MMNAVIRNSQAKDDAPEPLLEQARVDLATTMRHLGDTITLLEALHDTRQRGQGFLTYDQAQARDRLLRAEKRIRAWNQANGFPEPLGDIPAPGSITALNHTTLIHMALRHHASRTARTLLRDGYPTTPPPPDPSTMHLRDHLWTLANQAEDLALLEGITRDLTELSDAAQIFIDGTDRVLLPAHCPHCDRRTLVANLRDGTIRCDRDPKTGNFEPCVCSDPICDCKRDPRGHRHHWDQAKGGWEKLGDRLSIRRRS